MLEAQMLEALNSSLGERSICKFLGSHPELIRWSVCKTGGHSTYVLKEFPFGSKYKADFAVAMSYSGAWEVHLIELEPPKDIVITKAGLPSNNLNTAISQINDWKDYIEQNLMAFKQDLTEKCMKKNLLEIKPSKHVPTNYTNDYLNAIDTVIFFHYYIVIGMRENITAEQRAKINQIKRFSDVEIFSFGRILDVARQCDKYRLNPTQPIRITESEEE